MLVFYLWVILRLFFIVLVLEFIGNIMFLLYSWVSVVFNGLSWLVCKV